MNRFDMVKLAMRKARILNDERLAELNKARKKKLQDLANEADYQMFYEMDGRRKQNRKKRGSS